MKFIELYETPVMSSWIEDLTYRPKSKAVIMTLLSGGRYQINNVTPILYKRWVAASSKGKFWHKNIRAKFRTLRL